MLLSFVKSNKKEEEKNQFVDENKSEYEFAEN